MSEELGFTIEKRGDMRVIVWPGEGCRPATDTEIAMWDLLNKRTQLASTGGEAVTVVGVRISTDGFGSYIADSAMGIGAAMPGELREPLMTVAQHNRIVAAMQPAPASTKAVAWAICKQPANVDCLSAIYANRRAAEAHVASYTGEPPLYITPLYTHPQPAPAGVVVDRELLEFLADFAPGHPKFDELRALLNQAGGE